MAQIPVNAYVNPLINNNNPPGIGVFVGAQTTRAGVIGEIDNTCQIGSIYLSTAGKEYLKVANTATPAITDWQKVTTTAAD